MIDNLRSLAMLITVLEEGSFQSAADRLNVSATVVSQNIKSLEVRLGHTLLDRSKRSIQPTAQGRKLIGPARAMLDAAEGGFQALKSDPTEVSGNLIVSVPSMLSGGPLVNIVEDFLLANPRIKMDLRFENVQRHPIHDDVDLTIGLYPLNHKNIQIRDLRGGGGGFFAAPDLAERIERIPAQSVLTTIPLLMCYGFGSDEWAQAFQKEDAELDLDIPFRMKCDDVSVIYRLCVSGAGLTVLPHSMVREDVKNGRLVQVLKHISLGHAHFFAMWNGRSAKSDIIERFLDHNEEVLARVRAQSAQAE
ncbi:LysR family transcriptional regulator [Amylibacter sp. IMCC11727]|uniref:LysR family transcriptional regulator n=1 Tax=Amylibacter sp. IMCC11727 TaxID=3039851 RepID=UPI00244E112B|nr:LysR family transcriptional regulator [Amylibacter sp. IMCC11727]WGI20258.1 LysR family transcriptional regulator [Amylibacter sp. IMCC11727]